MLVGMLARAREACRTDFQDLPLCSMSAELGFAVAARRLPRVASLHLARALALRLADHLDSLATPALIPSPHFTSGSNYDSSAGAGAGVGAGAGAWAREGVGAESWSEELEKITDLVSALYSGSGNSADFQYYYELLLARRLLRARYISLPTELHALQRLPAVHRAETMLRDVAMAGSAMDRFLLFLLRRLDAGDGEFKGADEHEFTGSYTSPSSTSCSRFATLPQAARNLLFSHNVTVLCLTATAWPGVLLRGGGSGYSRGSRAGTGAGVGLGAGLGGMRMEPLMASIQAEYR